MCNVYNMPQEVIHAAEGMLIDAIPKLQCLTSLTLWFGQSQPPTNSLIRSNAPSISILTALQSLQMSDVMIDWSLLATLRHLRTLEMIHVANAEADGNLQVLSNLTALTSLAMDGYSEQDVTAEVAEAPTSSSHLASLKLHSTTGQLRSAHYTSMFPPGRQLQHLTELEIGAGILHHIATHQNPAKSCPNLQKVRLDFPVQAAGLDMGQVAAGLEAMSGFGQLQGLELDASALQFPTLVWQALGSLSQLTRLSVWCTSEGAIELCNDVKLSLTSCTSLQSLRIYTGWGMDIFLDSQVRLSHTTALCICLVEIVGSVTSMILQQLVGHLTDALTLWHVGWL